MHTIPIPCTNCLRFHYGVCTEAPKECFQCGGINHIERYCPRRRRVRIDPSEPLPGTRAWCDKHGLNDGAGLELKWKIRNAIKTSPGCAIWLDGICLYGGNQRHFFSDDRPRGRPRDTNTTRRRSRSPLRDRFQQRSLSPLRARRVVEYDDVRYDISPHLGRGSSYQARRFRSRSPIRQRSPSPYRHSELNSQSPRYSKGKYTVARGDEQNSPRSVEWTINYQKPAVIPYHLIGPQMSSFQSASCPPLENIINTGHDTITKVQKLKEKPSVLPTSKHLSASLDTPASEKFYVDDPHFILGVRKGAGQQESDNS